MKEKLHVEITQRETATRIKLIGIVDEDAAFDEIIKIAPNNIEFDFKDIEMINSCGIREWTNFIKALPEGAKIKYFNCTPDVIEQINMIVDFLGENAIVQTFYAPYFCNSCDKEEIVLLSQEEVKQATAPEKKCSTCTGTLEFDALEDQYFDFLNK